MGRGGTFWAKYRCERKYLTLTVVCIITGMTTAAEAKDRVIAAIHKLSRNQRNVPVEIIAIAKETTFTDSIVRRLVGQLVTEGFIEITTCTLTDDGYTKVTEYGQRPQ